MDVLHVHMLCYNEEYLIPFVLDYWSEHADKIYIYDNESNDSSLDIMKRYEKVEVSTFKTGGKVSDSEYLRIKNNEWKKSRGKSEWVAVVDTDEIVWYKEGLRKYLKSVKGDYDGIMPFKGYNAISSDISKPPKDLSFSSEDIFLTGTSKGYCGFKISIFRPTVKEISYSPGAHDIPKLNYHFGDSLFIHFHYIFGYEKNYERYIDRNNRLSDENKENMWGHHYSKQKEQIKQKMEILLKNAFPLKEIIY